MSNRTNESVADPEVIVRGLLSGAGITPSEEEFAAFVFIYPLLRAKADRVYELDLGDRP
jgi:hypothetical protein